MDVHDGARGMGTGELPDVSLNYVVTWQVNDITCRRPAPGISASWGVVPTGNDFSSCPAASGTG